MPAASVLAVRLFEVGCLLLWLAGLGWVVRTRNPLYLGAYTASALLVLFDWIFNSKWFFRVDYSSHFIPLWRIEGVTQPIALAMNYAFYFGARFGRCAFLCDRFAFCRFFQPSAA